jgi:type VI secretion system protein ImpA
VSSPIVLDLDRLLAPISAESPCGDSLRWDPLYDEIKQARREEDKDALGAEGPAQANWPLVISKSTEALAQRSKDLLLAAYLTEALVQVHGFAGLRDGLRLINGLLEGFWEGLYPRMDGDDLEPRAAPIVWFAEADRGARLPNRIRDVALAPGSQNGAAYSWAFWKSRYIAAKGETEDEGSYTRRKLEAEERAKAFEQAVAAAPLPHYAALREDIAECLAELGRLNTLLDQRFGRSAPGTTAIRQALEECGTLVLRIFKEKGGRDGTEDGAVAEGDGDATVAAAAPAGAAAAHGPIGSRVEALRRLEEVATYFRQTEPHSPVSYLVERASSWGRMSLEELMDELVKDSSARQQIGELLGFRKRE